MSTAASTITNNAETMSQELLEPAVSAVVEYQPFYAQLAELETQNAALVFDYESKKGNTEARSHVHKLRATKGALERTRKAAKEESLKKGRAIDAEAKDIEARIEKMIGVHQQHIDAIEQREAARIRAIQDRIGAVERMIDSRKSADLKARIGEIEAVAIDDSFGEFVADAAKAKDATLTKYRAMLVEAEQAEAQAAELLRLRKEAEERARREHDEAIARAAEEKARAEAAAAAERERAESARKVAEAEALAKAEREAAERRELELKLAAEAAERRRVESEQRAEQEKKDAEARAVRERQEAEARATREAAEAVKREQERVAAAAALEAAELAKREANKAHKARINRTALAALVEGGMTEECAKQCITLIASGKVPAVSISY